VPVPLPEHLLVIQQDEDDNEPFCLDTSRFHRGECPVVLYYPSDGRSENIAKDFLTFYEKYLGPYLQQARNTTAENRPCSAKDKRKSRAKRSDANRKR
jgi:hypothetical protein